MSVINNQRDMDNFLSDLRGSENSGEFTDKDREQIAEALPTDVLLKTLLARTADTQPTLPLRAESLEQKSDVTARILNAWHLVPELRLGQLIQNALESAQVEHDITFIFYAEDGYLVHVIEAFVKRYTRPPA